MSKRHLPAECNYEIYNKELLAIVHAFEEWCAELKESPKPMKVISDHKNLEYFMTTKRLSRRQARWSEFLSRFNFKITYKPGTQCKADPLTCRSQDLPKDVDPRHDYIEQIVLKPKDFDVSRIRILRRHDVMPMELTEEPELKDIETLITYAFDQLDPTDIVTEIIHQILSGVYHNNHISLSDCSVENGRLYHHGKLWIPSDDTLRLSLIEEVYKQPMTGQSGVAKTYGILQRHYYWPKMIDSVRRYIRNCHVCS